MSVNETNKEHTSSSPVSTHELLVTVKTHKWRLIFFMLLTFSACFWLFKYRILLYSSNASFVVNEPALIDPSASDYMMNDLINESQAFNRAQQLVISYDMINHLIRKFELYKHYGIDTTKEFYYEKTYRIVTRHISLVKNPFHLINVAFTDQRRYLTADVVNEISTYLDTLNKRLIINSIRKRLDISKIIANNLGKENRFEFNSFDSLLNKLNYSFGRMDKQVFQGGALLEFQQMYIQTVRALQNSTEELVKARKLYELTLQTINEKNLPTIVIISRGLPDASSNVPNALLLSAMSTVGLFFCYLFALNFVKQYKNYIKIFLKV